MYEVVEYHCQMCRVSKTLVFDDVKGERHSVNINCPECGKPIGWRRIRNSNKIESEGNRIPNGYPYESNQWGCLPVQVPEFVEHAKKMGCPTEYTKQGKAVFTDFGHYKKFMRSANRYFNNHTKGKPNRGE